MADAFEGDLSISPVTTSQSRKVGDFNATDIDLEWSTTGRMIIDAAGLSGTKTLVIEESRRSELDIINGPTAALTIQINDSVKQAYWVRDMTTGGFNIIIKSVGGSDNRVLPKKRWTLIRARADTMDQMAGWQDSSLAPSISFGTNYGVFTGRALKLYKAGADISHAGGRVTLEGAIEKSTVAPAAGDTMMTLPANYRPIHVLGFTIAAEPNVAANTEAVIIEITAAGTVILKSLLAWTPLVDVPIDLSGISFFAAG